MQSTCSSFTGQRLRAAAARGSTKQQRAPLRCRATLASPPAGALDTHAGSILWRRAAAAQPPSLLLRLLAEGACALLAAPKLFQYDGPLDEVDPEIASIIRNEKERQVWEGQFAHPVLVV
jgi:hypothetical protein